MQTRPSGPKSKTRTGWLIQPEPQLKKMTSTPLQIREVKGAGFVPRREIVERTVFEVADVLDRDRVPGDHGPRQHGHARVPVAVVARLLPEPPDEEQRLRPEQGDERLPERLPGREQRDDADGPGQRDPTAPPGSAAHVVVNRAGHPDGDQGTRQQRCSREESQYETHKCSLLLLRCLRERVMHARAGFKTGVYAVYQRGLFKHSSSRLYFPKFYPIRIILDAPWRTSPQAC